MGSDLLLEETSRLVAVNLSICCCTGGGTLEPFAVHATVVALDGCCGFIYGIARLCREAAIE